MSATRQTSLFGGLMLMSLALLVSAFIVFSLHVVIDELFGVQGEMRSTVGLLFVPILALPVISVACTVHLIAKNWFDYKTWLDWVSAGGLYALLFLIFVSPWLLIVPLAINPIVVTWWVKRKRQATTVGP